MDFGYPELDKRVVGERFLGTLSERSFGGGGGSLVGDGTT